MAKGLRASSRKKNSQALRARLYGPAADARAERLSAKLQELAAKPRSDQEKIMDADEVVEKQASPNLDLKDEVMEVDSDDGALKSTKRSSGKKPVGRTQKKIAKRKAKKAVVFPDIKAKWRKQASQKQRS